MLVDALKQVKKVGDARKCNNVARVAMIDMVYKEPEMPSVMHEDATILNANLCASFDIVELETVKPLVDGGFSVPIEESDI